MSPKGRLAGGEYIMAKDLKDTAIYVAYEESEPLDSALAERNLLRAILLNALHDLRKNGDQAKKAIEYFLNPEDDYIFSFKSVCNHLDLDGHRVLQVIGLSNGRPRKPVVQAPLAGLETTK